jgi:hypothetical protein
MDSGQVKEGAIFQGYIAIRPHFGGTGPGGVGGGQGLQTGGKRQKHETFPHEAGLR